MTIGPGDKTAANSAIMNSAPRIALPVLAVFLILSHSLFQPRLV